MSLIKQLLNLTRKFSPASADVNWTRVETLVHGPGASGTTDTHASNSAIFACLMTIATSYPEPPLKVYRKLQAGKNKEMPGHPFQALIDRPTPNGELSMEDILFWTSWAKHTDGNAYWLKVRSGDGETGNVIELWPISPLLMTPVSENGEWISYYKYQIEPNRYVRVPVPNVIHFRMGVDDRDMRKGLSPLKALVREIASDDEASKFTSALLQNYAVPGLVVIPTAGTMLNEDDADRLTERLRRKFGSDNRGNIAVMSKESKVEQFGFSPADMDMSIMHRIPEERISAVFGIAAIVAGLGAGLDRATYANFKEAREMFTEQKLIPMWRSDAARINANMRKDFTSQASIFVDFDLSEVRALQEDQDARYTRLKAAVNKPWMTRNEARTEVGLDPVEGWDEEDIAPPEPPPAQLQEPGQEQDQENEMANGAENNPSGKGALIVELKRWQRAALARFREGKGADFEYVPKTPIPYSLILSIRAELAAAKSASDIRAAFVNGEASPVDPLIILADELRRATNLLEATSAQ